MPRTLLLSHLVLLLCLSVLAGAATTVLLFGAQRFTIDATTASDLTSLTVALAAVLFITEVFSGVRWPPVIALGALIFGRIAMHGGRDVPIPSMYAWVVAWLAVAFWFAWLADVARRNR